MFHNAHAYVTKRLYKSEDDLLLIGSILPDIAITKIIGWDDGLHGSRNMNKFAKYIKNKPDYINLYRGVYVHNIVDNLAHKRFSGGKGYAYQNNREIVRLIISVYGLSLKDAQIKAHNYLESAVDILLLQKYPEIQTKIRIAIKRTDVVKLSTLLSIYFNQDRNEFANALSQYFNLIIKYDLSKKQNWILFWDNLEELMSLKRIDNDKKKEILNKSISISKNSYENFLNNPELTSLSYE
ncbi:MAG: zinc dependent phospholipase C family protein [Patescibacteria group bacterium]